MIKILFTDILGFFFGIALGFHIRSQLFVISHCMKTPHQVKRFPILTKEVNLNFANREKAELRNGTVYIGLMSAHKYLDSRVDAAINTWMNYLPPNVKVEVFADNEGEMDVTKKIRQTSLRNGVRVIQLPGVSDRFYPPQKKSFSMIKFMHDVYIDKFDWFVRLDDDAYIEPRNILKLLARLNSTQPILLGHVGYGLHDEDYLGENDTFCMGGTGVVFSKQLLRKLAPNLKECLNNLFTEHEDVEVGRCIQKTTGVQCTTAWETAEIFYQDFKTNTGYIQYLDKATIDKVVTLHPNKNPAQQNRLHTYLLQRKINRLITKFARLENDIRRINKSMFDIKQKKLGKTNYNSRNRHIGDETTRSVFLDQAFFNDGRTMKSTIQTSFKKVLSDYDESFKLSNIRRGRSVQSLSRDFTYYRSNPLFSVDSVSKMTITYSYGSNRNQTAIIKQRQYFPKRIQFFNEPVNFHLNSFQDVRNSSSNISSAIEKEIIKSDLQVNNQTVINFFMVLSGRTEIFLRFLKRFEAVFMRSGENVNLIVVYFPNNSPNSIEGRATTDEISVIENSVKKLQKMYLSRTIKLVNMNETTYCKTVGLQTVNDHIQNDEEIIFFCDVDMLFDSSDFLRQIRRNTIQGKRVYYPVTFSQFNPGLVSSRPTAVTSPSDFAFKEIEGFWRYYGFGMLSIYKSDFMRTNGFDTKICGWGQEDVEMVNSIMKAGLDVFQSPVPHQIHVYHEKFCSESLPSNRLVACKAVRLLHYGAKIMLYNLYLKRFDNFSSF